MDKRVARRIDSLYRNYKQLPTLGCLGALIPVIGVFLLPISLAYIYLRSKLVNDVREGRVAADKEEETSGPNDVTTAEKIRYLTEGDAAIGLPLVVGSFWFIVVIGLIVYFKFG